MPKGKRKGKSDRSKYEGSTSEDDSYNNDNASVISNCSENRSTDDTEDGAELALEQLEDKLFEIIDGMSQKSAQTRIDSIKTLSKALVKKYIPEIVKTRLFTISDALERCLKKGAGAEKAEAAELITLLCLQLGELNMCEDVFKQFAPILLTVATDNSVDPKVRAKCCTALGNLTFLSSGEMRELGEVLRIMQQMEGIFSGSFLKGDGSVPNVSLDQSTSHAAALSAWTLLFTLLSEPNAVTKIEQIAELLQSPHLEVRLAAGESLAIVFELGRSIDENYEDDFADEIVVSLKQLATDSHKFRAKKDRKLQRATFRDILQFIEEDKEPFVTVKFGKEELTIDSWSKRKQYEVVCNFLGPGINNHLADNNFLREILEIPLSLQNEVVTHAANQMERNRRKLQNAVNFKARTISRAKNRDKRSDF